MWSLLYCFLAQGTVQPEQLALSRSQRPLWLICTSFSKTWKPWNTTIRFNISSFSTADWISLWLHCLNLPSAADTGITPVIVGTLQPVSLIKHMAWRTCTTSLATAIKRSGQAHLPSFKGRIKAPRLFLIKLKGKSDHWTEGWDLPRLLWPLTLPSRLHKLSLKTDLALHWWLFFRHPSWRLSEMGNPKVPLAADPQLVKN